MSKEINLSLYPDGTTNKTLEWLSKVTPPSSNTAKHVFECVDMPRKVSGLKVVDLGAGASGATAKLLEMGADAYAVDPKFSDFQKLIAWCERSNATFEPRTQREKNLALRAFRKSISGRSRNRYIATSATDLNMFEDNSVDIVFSRVAVLAHLDIDYSFLGAIAKESLRIIRPQGSIRLFPFMDYTPGFPKELNAHRIQNHMRLFRELDGNQSLQVDISERAQGKLLVVSKN